MAGDFQLEIFNALLDPSHSVDPAKLICAARIGIPQEVRPAVWNFLLGISKPAVRAGNAACALSALQAKEYDVRIAALDLQTPLVQRIRSALKRARVVRRAALKSSSSLEDVSTAHTAIAQKQLSGRGAQLAVPDADGIAAFTRVIALYLSGVDDTIEFHSDMVYLAAPFLEIMPTEAEAYYAFAALMQKHEALFTFNGLNASVTEFLSIFRYKYRDLHELCVSEEVDMKTWASSWLRSLLARQMPRDSLLRLWDAYFSTMSSEWIQLHPYICLLLVGGLRNDLQDCEDGERIVARLAKPNITVHNPTRLLVHARNMREELKGAGVI